MNRVGWRNEHLAGLQQVRIGSDRRPVERIPADDVVLDLFRAGLIEVAGGDVP
jgi:hypothetical protein